VRWLARELTRRKNRTAAAMIRLPPGKMDISATLTPIRTRNLRASYLTMSTYRSSEALGKGASKWRRFREYFRPVMDDSIISAMWDYYSPHYHTDEEWKRFYEAHRKAYPQGQPPWRGMPPSWPHRRVSTHLRQAWMLTSARASLHSSVSRLRQGGRTRGPRPLHVARSRRTTRRVSRRASPSSADPDPPRLIPHNSRFGAASPEVAS
jgi:hypothetical protein